MIVEDLFTMMSTLNNEYDLTSGGTDESRGLSALNMAIDYMETVAASMPKILSTMGKETLKTAQSIESTPIPNELLRIDRLWALDVSTKLPLYPMRRIDEAARYVPFESLCLSPQCGFASTFLGNPISEDVQRRKLERVVEVATEVWGTAR